MSKQKDQRAKFSSGRAKRTGRVVSVLTTEVYRESGDITQSFLTFALDGGQWFGFLSCLFLTKVEKAGHIL